MDNVLIIITVDTFLDGEQKAEVMEKVLNDIESGLIIKDKHISKLTLVDMGEKKIICEV